MLPLQVLHGDGEHSTKVTEDMLPKFRGKESTLSIVVQWAVDTITTVQFKTWSDYRRGQLDERSRFTVLTISPRKYSTGGKGTRQ
jgi:hypothetical protein